MRERLVSTIIPVFNRPVLVQEAIATVLAQTYRPIEIIVVDDGSTDDTREAVERMMSRHPEIRLLRQSNAGPGAARQKGLDAASGEYIQFLDSDDLLAPSKFEKQVAQLDRHPECGICYGWTIRYPFGGAKDMTPVKWTGRKFDSMFPSFLADRWWETTTPLYRAGLIFENGPWLNLRQEEDWEFDCRLASRGVQLTMVASIVSEMRLLPEGRLSLNGSTDPSLLRDRCAVRIIILGHAVSAGIEREEPHMRHFLDSSFLVARQAALAGLEAESAELIQRLNEFDRRFLRTAYLRLGKAVGFHRATQIAEATRHALKRIAAGVRKP